MSNVIVVDSACDLPDSILKSKHVAVLPLNLHLGDDEVRDVFTAEERLSMIRNGSVDLKHRAESAPATRDQIIDFLTKRVLPRHDFAMVQTVARSRSPQFEMWQEVNMTFAAHYRKYRNSDNTFTLRTVDSGTMFTGQGLMALHTLYLAGQKVPRRQLLEQSKQFADHIQSYSAPADLHYMRERTRQKGDRSISFLSALLGKALDISPIVYGGQNQTAAVAKVKGHENAVNKIIDHAVDCIKHGLRAPLISIAYAGPLEELDQFDRLQDLKTLAKQQGIKVATSVATLSTIVNLGPGNFSLAVAPNDADFRLTA